MNVLMIFPTLGRVEQALRCLWRFHATAPDLGVCIVSHDGEAAEFAKLPNVWHVIVTPTESVIEAGNLGLKTCPLYDAYMTGADDLWPEDDWWGRALPLVRRNRFLALPDGTRNRAFATHHISGRDFLIQHQGGVFSVPHYHAWYADCEVSMRAQRADALVWADCVVEHRHHVWGKAPMDATYQRASKWYEHDRDVYIRRMGQGFPDDFEPILPIVT